MGKVIFSISMSLDGFITAPNDEPGWGLGEGGEVLHDWVHGGEWGSFGAKGIDAEVLGELVAEVGAIIVGRRTFEVSGAWGGHSPGGLPCFVMTHRPPEEWVREGSPFTFVTDGVESALAQARAVAGDRGVAIGGGADVGRQFLRAGLVDDLQIHLAPVLLGAGIRLFEIGSEQVRLRRTRVLESPFATHLRFEVAKD
ncbi:dihydrofolate reductase family protein [Nonomuraea sp. NEAU-A123]|uniref:dihydrofolate reductase family protein n=1 Tax=Nonomuraea sp. NEAU-A123 TaxID=2839649 RepID=UPI001BE40E26|nr:dihydrofolate reductase family protein [Nonomuraea sp. NEAU-A123]MBT2230600.1 dihydrofolate reductase family protein [Nonomuraea sp. NEAU-A123]